MTFGKHLAGRLLARWETLLVLAMIAVGAWSTARSSAFLTRGNLLDFVRPSVFVGLMAFGLTFVVVAGEIDISVASTLAVSVVSFAQIFAAGVNVWLAALAGLAVATALGLVNGVLVGILNLPSLAITLGTLAAYQGLAFVVLKGEGVAEFPSAYTNLGGGYVAGNQLPVALLVLLAVALGLGLLLHATRFGRYLYAIGSNREAARFSGIPVARVRVTVFALSGLMAGVAGVIWVGGFGARADAGQGSLLDVVTAVVLGGVDIFGGAGSMLGVLLALVLVAELRSGMQLANIAGDTQDIVIGGLLLAAIVAGNLLRAARADGFRTGRLRLRRRGVIGHETAEAVMATQPQNLKGR